MESWRRVAPVGDYCVIPPADYAPESAQRAQTQRLTDYLKEQT